MKILLKFLYALNLCIAVVIVSYPRVTSTTCYRTISELRRRENIDAYFKNKFRNYLDSLTIENPGRYVTSDELLKKVQVGDLIEFQREGYVHWGMYSGDGTVIHLRNTGEKRLLDEPTGIEDQSRNKQKEVLVGVVEMTKLEEVAKGRPCRINNLENTSEKWSKRAHIFPDEYFERRTPEQAVKEARNMLFSEIEYDILYKNCEHVVTKWKYNISHSDQVAQAYNATKIAVVGAAIIAAPVVAGVGAMAEELEAKKERQRKRILKERKEKSEGKGG